MKKAVLLNRDVSAAVASAGHLDMLAVVDAGYPLPAGPERIDLAVRANVPRLLDVVEAIVDELKVESILLAEEIGSRNQAILLGLTALLPDIPITYQTHARLKATARDAKAVIRTGEFTPFGNVILVSGVTF